MSTLDPLKGSFPPPTSVPSLPPSPPAPDLDLLSECDDPMDMTDHQSRSKRKNTDEPEAATKLRALQNKLRKKPSTSSESSTGSLEFSNHSGAFATHTMMTNGDRLEFSEPDLVPQQELAIILQPSESGKSLFHANALKLRQELLKNTKYETDIVRIKHLRRGGLVVVTTSEHTLNSLKKLKSIVGINITSSPPKSDACITGIITDVSAEITDGELLQEFSHCGRKVQSVKRILNYKKEPTTVLIFFEGKQMPDRIFIGYNSYQVRQYIPPPVQCFKCHRFGHGASVCRSQIRCLHCGDVGHDHKSCAKKTNGANPICCNCGDSHPACANKCPARKVSLKIAKHKTQHNVTFAEAKQAIIPKGSTYADVIRGARPGSHPGASSAKVSMFTSHNDGRPATTLRSPPSRSPTADSACQTHEVNNPPAVPRSQNQACQTLPSSVPSIRRITTIFDNEERNFVKPILLIKPLLMLLEENLQGRLTPDKLSFMKQSMAEILQQF